MTPIQDDDYQIIFVGSPDFADYFQASLRLDTFGGPNDICTVAP